MTTPIVHRYHTTEFLSRAHLDEFIVVIDSLGRRWNPLLHPRDENGRFIRTFSFVTFDLPGGVSTPGGAGGSVSGRVSGIDRDGNLLVKVSGVGPGAPPGVNEGDYVKVPHDKVEVRTVKAQLGGKGAAGRLNNQENKSVTTGIANLKRLGLDAQADKLAEAQGLANEAPDPRDPASVERKQRAIDLMREVGEELGAERGKGFDEGVDYEEIKDTLSSDEKAKLQTLDSVMGTTFTARHSLGDKTIDAQNDEGPIKAKAGEVRIQTAEQELRKDFEDDVKVWDATSGTLEEGHLEQPVKAEVRDDVREQQGQQVLPELQRSTYQRLKSGLSRLSGYKQAAQVAPGDRYHSDKNGDEVVVGSIVHTDPTKSREGFTGMVTRIYTDKAGKKHVYVRDFDPSGDKGYPKKYKDHSVQGGSIELAGDDEQDTVFQQLALMGASDSAKSLVNSFTTDYIDKMSRRYASPDAKRISPTGGFFDVAPVGDRVRADANGEQVRIGDSVMGPNGEVGVVTYIEPNENTVKVQYPNGQQAARVSSRKVTRLHGPSSDVYPGESGYGDNNYVPTREEAAAIADEMGADSVAQVIRDGGDSNAIQAAMVTDVAFQGELDDVDALYDTRDKTLSAGQELGEEDRTKLGKWDRLAAASAGQFREEPEKPPVAPEPPAAEGDGEPPKNPANPTEKVTEGGTTVREDGENVIVGDNTEDPIPGNDQEAIDQAVEDAEGAQPPEAPEEPVAQALAQKLVSDLGRLVDEAKQAPNVDSNQRAQLDQMNSRLIEAVDAKDGDAVVRALQGLTGVVNKQVNANLRQTRLAAVLNGRATDGVPMAEFIQQKLDAGQDIFGAPEPVSRPDRPAERPDETPEGVDPKVDKADNAVSEALTLDDGSTLVMVGDDIVEEGFYVMDPETITEYDNEPTTKDITDFLNETQGSDYDGVSVWFDEDDGRYRMARVGVFENEQDATDAAANSGTNQYVNISDGAVMNVALGGDPNAPTEAVEDPRSEERTVRTAGAGSASARSTAKQKKMLDHVSETSGDADLGRIAEAIKNGEEISGADASRLADAIDAMDAGQFDKPSDKGVASQLAHRLARAAGEEGARGYSSQNTALRRTSDVGISLSAQSQDDAIRTLTTDAREDIKNGDNAAAAQKFREAADAFDALGLGNDVPSRRAREHADRLEAMGGTTAPAPEGVVAPEAPEQVPGEAADGGPEPLDVSGSPTEILENLFDRIGQPADYGTEHQGRRLGEARSLAAEGLTKEASSALESAASAEPDGSNQKRLMLEASDALLGLPEGDTGPTTPTPEGDVLAEVTSALGSVDTAIDSEREAPMESGRPGGWSDAIDDVNAQLGLIRGKVTSEGPYTQLSKDLRDLADSIEEGFTLSDTSGVVDELRATADTLDGGPETPAEETPEGPAPGGEGGGAPFRVDDPSALHAAFLDEQRRHDLVASEDSHLNDVLRGTAKLLNQVETGSVANAEVNRAKFEEIKRNNGAAMMRENLDRKIRDGTLTPEDITTQLDQFGDDAQAILDIWNGNVTSPLAAEKLDDFMSQRIDASVATAREEANGASDEAAPFDLRWIRSQMETGSIESANRIERGRIRTLDEYEQMVTEMASLLSTAQALRDPKNRASLRADQIRDLPRMMLRFDADTRQAKEFFAEMEEQGVDTTALKGALTEQLDKFEAGDILDPEPQLPQDVLDRASKSAKLYHDLRYIAGDPATKEGADAVSAMLDLVKASNTPAIHRQLAPAVMKIVQDQQMLNGGTIPDELRAVMEDPAWQRFGAFSEVLGRLDIDDIIKSGNTADLAEITGGRYTSVDWGPGPISPDLVSDDRPEGSGTVEGDIAWKEAMDSVTPNVAGALNSMFTAMGGGIHRVPTDITQANHPAAERWKGEGWNRPGSDVRTPDQVEGVYAKDSNLVVIAESRSIVDTGRGSHVLVHELGHALDSMLGETLAEGGWFTEQDPEFKKFHESIKDAASFGSSPEQSLMYWYFRNADEGATKHNGNSGHKEVFAEGYAAYAQGLQRLANMPEGSGPITEETTYALIGRQLTGDRGQLVEWAGELNHAQVRGREVKIGKAIMAYFDDLEKNRLPKIMAEPKPMPVRSELRNVILGLEQGAAPQVPIQKIATPSQKAKADVHNSLAHGLIKMQAVERGTPEWDAMEAAIKQASPGAGMPSPTALYVTWNPDFASQGVSVIWKAVMPSQPEKPTTEYTDQHKATQLAAKFQREQRNNAAIDKAHVKAEAEAAFDETAALVLAMIETGMRVGSSERAGSIDKKTGKKVPTFGGATMQAKHVFFPSDTLMRFKFPGKAGKENIYESRNPALRAAVQQLIAGKKPSDQVFSNTNSGRSIDYLREATGIVDIINHDTRTRYATNMARALVAKWPKSRMPKNEKELDKAKAEISKKVGIAINDTWTVARDSYISPAVWEPMEDTAGVPHSFDDSPPYGLIEGDVVQSIGGPPVGGGPAAPEGETPPPAPVAAAAMTRNVFGDLAPEDAPMETRPSGESAEPEIEFSLDQSPEGVEERAAWYASYQWPEPPIVAAPDTTYSAEDGDDEPAQTEAPAEPEPEES